MSQIDVYNLRARLRKKICQRISAYILANNGRDLDFYDGVEFMLEFFTELTGIDFKKGLDFK